MSTQEVLPKKRGRGGAVCQTRKCELTDKELKKMRLRQPRRREVRESRKGVLQMSKLGKHKPLFTASKLRLVDPSFFIVGCFEKLRGPEKPKLNATFMEGKPKVLTGIPSSAV